MRKLPDKSFDPNSFESKWPRTKLTSSRGLHPRSRGALIRGKQSFNPESFEGKWQGIWHKTGINKTNFTSNKKPFYNLMMFPYPSAEPVHQPFQLPRLMSERMMGYWVLIQLILTQSMQRLVLVIMLLQPGLLNINLIVEAFVILQNITLMLPLLAQITPSEVAIPCFR